MLQATQIKRRCDRLKVGTGRPEISHGDNVLSMVGLLCMGKSDFEAINAFEAESDEFFRLALGMGRVPSEPTLRQRLDLLGAHDAASTPLTESRVRTISAGGICGDGATARAEADGVLQGLDSPGFGRVAVRQQ